MALDVGAVTIDYSLARPSGAAYSYAHELMEFEDIVEDYWKVTSGWNVFIELKHDTMVGHAEGYVRENGLTKSEAHEVMGWVESLPWVDNRVMLHLGRH